MLKEPLGFCLWATEVPQQKGQSSLPCPSAPRHPHLHLLTSISPSSSAPLSSSTHQSFLHIFLPSSQYVPTNPQPVTHSSKWSTEFSSRTHPHTHLPPSPPLTLPKSLFTLLPSGKCPFYSIISIPCPACARICANPSPGPWLSVDSGAEMGHSVLGMREGHWGYRILIPAAFGTQGSSGGLRSSRYISNCGEIRETEGNLWDISPAQ